MCVCVLCSSSRCLRPNTAPQPWRWRRVSARYARSGSSWPGQTLRGPSSSSPVWRTWVPERHTLRHEQHLVPKGFLSVSVSKITRKLGGVGRFFAAITGAASHLSQNFCSEAVCYSEMITRKIERNQLGRDHKSFTVQVTPIARQSWGRPRDDVHSKCQRVFSPWQHKGLSGGSDMFTPK